ncbi:MBOAT family O-acyltransferase [Algibacter sp. L3A6]|uniref:MBOAT family O-acyltransferase n=1 Tax=Algibacter sp. L3A6 TaxID=2686366 RepID=UPI00293B9BBF|nr:MBOAT family O-acyltransferase [Algibacter sp. L3A6]
MLVASYFFYGIWDWRFLSLILLSTIVDYIIGHKIHDTDDDMCRKRWLWCSVIFNIGLLGFFKYYNFFIDSWVDLASTLGYTMKSTWTLKVILPVGISFYTFQTMSYSFDIYYRKLKPTKSFLSFAAFVSFFPQLVAGPIERASNLLSQISNKRHFSYAQSVSGLKLILWGLVKKVVIADALGPIVDDIFSNYGSYPSSTLLIGAIFFGFQIYGDFSGYSDIAIGTAKLFGIELMSNFKFPYFSRNIAEFWRRWHISLSSWFQAYIYVPLGGSREGKLKTIRNVFIIFLVSGIWHGANWTFVLWGLVHALIFIPVLLLGNNTKYKNTVIAQDSLLPSVKELLSIFGVFFIVTMAWIFFRSESIGDAFSFIGGLTEFSSAPYFHPNGYRMVDYYILVVLFLCYEFIIRKDERAPFNFKNRYVRFLVYAIMVFVMMLFYDSGIDRSFIYFQF